MKRMVIWLGLFCGMLIGGDISYGVLTRSIMAHSGFRFARVYCGKRMDADVVILGNSRAVNAFDAIGLSKKTGRRWLNLGYNGMGPQLVEAVLLDYLDRHEKPELVVLELSNVWQNLGAVRDLRIFDRYSSRLMALDMINNKTVAHWAKFSSLFAANSEMLWRMTSYVGRSDQDWVNHGQLRETDADNAVAKASETIGDVVSESNAAAYKRIFQALERQGIPYKTIVTPYLLTEQAHDRLIGAMSNALPRTSIIDHSTKVRDITSFADPLHLNRRGRMEYSKILEETLGTN